MGVPFKDCGDCGLNGSSFCQGCDEIPRDRRGGCLGPVLMLAVLAVLAGRISSLEHRLQYERQFSEAVAYEAAAQIEEMSHAPR
jgi:hypothetical protein